MLEKLNDRERMFVFVGGLVAVAAVLIMGIMTILGHRSALRADVQKARQDLQKIREMGTLIQRLPSGSQAPTEEQLKNQLRQMIESQGLQRSSMNSNVTQVNKGQEKVQVDISFNSEKLVDIFQFLYQVEVSGAVSARVEDLQITRPYAEKEVYDVRLKIAVQRPSQGGGDR
ncbi:MAG: hypothetical protein CMN76_14350 [Spirochaetaceae bacterium]|nr:hypothetical protein [Spirochaetaceae bacterium]|tara:strand:- start:143910 stop:144425 length:516 start_codon:yes stop_codon:yes gene_type:complete